MLDGDCRSHGGVGQPLLVVSSAGIAFVPLASIARLVGERGGVLLLVVLGKNSAVLHTHLFLEEAILELQQQGHVVRKTLHIIHAPSIPNRAGTYRENLGDDS